MDTNEIILYLAKKTKEAGIQKVVQYYPTSSNLHKSVYYPKLEYLEMTFHNKKKKPTTTYKYIGVPQSEMDGLNAASSRGSYFYHNIRTSFKYRRIG